MEWYGIEGVCGVHFGRGWRICEEFGVGVLSF